MVIAEALKLLDENEALIILQELLGISKLDLRLNLNRDLADKEEDFLAMVKRRKEGYPLQYLLGKWWFYDLELDLTEDVLIPRFETEYLVERLLNDLKGHEKVLEIGVGSGAISISLAKAKPSLDITAIDISEKALLVAQNNAIKNGVNNIKFIQSDLFSSLEGQKYSIIISNPPYIPEGEKKKLAKELSYEPDLALYSGQDGLDLLRRLVKDAPSYMEDAAFIYLEIGHDQGPKLRELLEKEAFKDIEIYKDLNGFDRNVKARLDR